MHQSSFDLMKKLLERVAVRFDPNQKVRVLDCGSALADTGMQKTYRELVTHYGFEYTGFDAVPGRNVDVVGDIYDMAPLRDQFDLIISGQMLEHLTFPLLAAQEMKEILKLGGWVIWIAPWQYGIHRYPIDCWRVLPDGMMFLLEGLENVEAWSEGKDCWGLGRKSIEYLAPWEIRRA